MKLPAYITRGAGKFDRLSLRERLLVLAAAFVLLVGGCNLLLLGPVDARRKALLQEVTDLQSRIALDDKGVEATLAADPTNAAAEKLAALQKQLDSVDSHLSAQSAGMVAPARMTEVIRDLLSHQSGIVLVSLRNLPPARLPPDKIPGAAEDRRLYVHSVDLVLEGHYLDVLSYLRTLESLPWHFYWRRLELTTTTYPTNRVRVELGTLSHDGDWMGL